MSLSEIETKWPKEMPSDWKKIEYLNIGKAVDSSRVHFKMAYICLYCFNSCFL